MIIMDTEPDFYKNWFKKVKIASRIIIFASKSVFFFQKLNLLDEYDGHWLDGRMHGQGTYRYTEGDVLKNKKSSKISQKS